MSKKKIILIGGGGHCKSCIEVVLSTGEYEIAGILDKEKNVGQQVAGFDIIGTDNDLEELRKKYEHALICIGQIKTPELRKSIFDKLRTLDFKLKPIIASSAYVSSNSNIGEGTIIMHDALINSGTKIGKNCIINSKALIEHDVQIGNHCHISTGSIINGFCVIGNDCFVGSGSILHNNIHVSDGVTISAGAVIKKAITRRGTYIGNPATKK